MERRIDLDRARRDAKVLLRAAQHGDSEALSRVRSDRAPRLADAQHAVARELGEPSWPALVRRVGAQLAADVDELLALVFAGEHHAAITLTRARPALAQQLCSKSAVALIKAAWEGRADAVYTLLELGLPANTRDPGSGGTALHVAARLGWLDVVGVLVGWVPLDRQARDAVGANALDACIEGSARAPSEVEPAGGDHFLVAEVLAANGLRPTPGAVGHMSEKLAGWLGQLPAKPAGPEQLGEELDERAWAADVALFDYVSRSPLAERRDFGEGFAFRTGLFDNTRNGVVYGRLPVDAVDERIGELLAWLGEYNAPAQWMVSQQTQPVDLREHLERAGCRPERSAVYMAARLSNRDLSDRRLPEGVEIALVCDRNELAEAGAGADTLDDDPEQRERELALLTSLGLADERPLRHHAARLRGRPVGIASTFLESSTLSLVELAVAATERRRGIGRALILHTLREGIAAGCTLALLSATRATTPFYEKLGFRLGRLPPDRAFYTPVRSPAPR